jgi:hypothetical protein
VNPLHRILGGIVVCLAALALVSRWQTRRAIGEFLSAETHPVNLAVFRIVMFTTLLFSIDVSELCWFGSLPPELRFPPVGLGVLVRYLPPELPWVRPACVAFLILSLSGLVGLFSRSSALLVAILSFYLHGLPQLFGKVDHKHYLVWFPLLLAVSPCGDVLACDAIRLAWKRADRGITAPPAPARAYALPLRFVWLLLAVIYFFPGFWKLWGDGFGWALSDNLSFTMQRKWTQLGGWTPAFRLDQHPVLCQAAALATMLFELSFVFLIFVPSLRFLAAVGGIVFHQLTSALMRIDFHLLVPCYVTFVDWHRAFDWMGDRLFVGELHLLYDGHCRPCRRTVAALRTVDVFGRVTYGDASETANPRAIDRGRLIDLHRLGLSAWRTLAFRIPLLWPALPFFHLFPATVLAAHPAADAGRRTLSLKADDGKLHSRSRAAVVLGSLLIAGNALFGAARVSNGWPLACFPLFGRIRKPELRSFEFVALGSSGDGIPLDEHVLKSRLSQARLGELLERILGLPNAAERERRLRALWSVWVREEPRLASVATLRFYRTTLTTVPEHWGENPLQRELILEFRPVASG